MLKRFIQILALAVPLALVACNGTTTTSPGTGSDNEATVVSYTGTYTGSTTGINGGPTTMVIAADKSVKGTFTINNRTDDNGIPAVYEATFDGTVDSNGKVSVNSFLEGALVMIFTGQINSSGGLTGTYYEFSDINKGGSFTLQGPANGATTTTTSSAGSAAKSCTGSYVGNYSYPERSERIRLRNLSLAGRGIAVTGNDAIDNGNAGGGDPDGGIWMAGSYAFETDGNCNVIKGKTYIFYAYEYDVSGVVVKGGTSNLIWSGQGSVGDMQITVDANNSIGGQFFHPAPDNFVYGVISGTFTPNGKI